MSENASDPVQLYLTQMGNSRLLSRQEEYQAARQIEHARRQLRRAILAADYVLQAAVAMLERVSQGRMRLEVVCDGPFSNEQRKRRLTALLRPNVQTLQTLLKQNRDDFSAAVSKQTPPEHRHQVRRRMSLRRAKAIRLAEELPVRRQHLQLVLQRLRDISHRMDAIHRELNQPGRRRPISPAAPSCGRNCTG